MLVFHLFCRYGEKCVIRRYEKQDEEKNETEKNIFYNYNNIKNCIYINTSIQGFLNAIIMYYLELFFQKI